MRRSWPGLRRGPRRRAARAAARAAAFAIALGVAAAGGLALRLAQGPTPLGPAGDMIAALASRALPEGEVEIGAVSLVAERGPGAGLAIRLDGVTLRDAAGRPVFTAPETMVALRPLALLAGAFRPTKIVIRGAGARLTRAESGEFSFGVGPAAQEAAAAGAQAARRDAAHGPAPDAGPDGAPEEPEEEARDAGAAEASAAALLEALSRGAAPGALADLRSVTLERLRLVYDDRASGRVWTAERADLRLATGPGGLRATASILLPQGRLGPVTLRGEGVRAADGAAAFSVSFSGAAPADLAAQLPALAELAALDAPLQGRADVAIDRAGALTGFTAEMRAAAGTLRLGETTATLGRADAALRLDPATGRLDLTRFSVAGPAGAAAGAGAAMVERSADGAARSVLAEIDLDALSVAADGAFAASQTFDGGRVSLRARFDPLRLEVAEAHLNQRGLRLTARGDAARDEEGRWRGAMTARLGPAPAAQIVALWPPAAAPGARVWLAENLTAGRIDGAELAARLGPEGPVAALTFAFSGAEAHYLRPMPPIEGGRGWAALEWGGAGRDGAPRPPRFALALDAGVVSAPGGGAIDLTGSSFAMPDVEDPLARASVSARGAGPLAAALATLDMAPLGLPSRIGLDPRSVGGAAEAQARIDLPLLRDLLLEQVAVSVVARLSDVTARPPGLDLAVAAEALTLEADTRAMRLSGAARLDGLPAEIDLREDFDPGPGEPSTRVALSGELALDQLAARGLDLAPFATGRARGAATVERHAGGAVAFDATLDLAEAALDAAPLDWRKAAGAPARLRAAGRIEEGAASLSTLALDAPGLALEGAAAFAEDGTLRRLALGRLWLEERIDAGLTVTRAAADAGLTARLDGALLDLAAFGEQGEGGEEAGPPVTAEIAVDRLRIAGPLALTEARGRFARREGRSSATVSGRAGAATVTAEQRRGSDGETVRLTADDAGALLRAAGLFDDGVGGRLVADARVTRAGGLRLEGEAEVTGMAISDDPALEEMLARADLDAAREGSVRFDLIRAPFALEGDRVTLGETVAYGPDIGVTIKGGYDIARDKLDLDGVFSPAFALNGVLSEVPLLGPLLTGGEGRGLVAFNFRVSGDAADPEVSVNPLSVLTPGILRQLFSGEGDRERPRMDQRRD